MTFTEFIVAIFSYLIGSFPTAYIFGLIKKHKDIRMIGTKNMGALNVYKSIGPLFGILTLLIDGFKGYLPIYFALRNNFSFLALGICIVMVISGHNWSIFLQFHGGKGASTSAGIILALFPKVFLSSFFIFIFLTILTNNVSFGLGVSFLFLPFLVRLHSYSIGFFYLSFLIPMLGIIRLYPNFVSMLKESNGKFFDMLKITLHGFNKYKFNKKDGK